MKAHFDIAAAQQALSVYDSAAHYDWSRARLALGVNSSVGITKAIALDLPGGVHRELKPINLPVSTGETPPFTLDAAQVGDLIKARAPFDVAAQMDLSGAERFSIATFAKNTTTSMSAQWPNPSFEGGFLPVNHQITKTGFTATWSAPLEARGIPEVG